MAALKRYRADFASTSGVGAARQSSPPRRRRALAVRSLPSRRGHAPRGTPTRSGRRSSVCPALVASASRARSRKCSTRAIRSISRQIGCTGTAPRPIACSHIWRCRKPGSRVRAPPGAHTSATLSTTRWRAGGELRRTVGPVTGTEGSCTHFGAGAAVQLDVFCSARHSMQPGPMWFRWVAICRAAVRRAAARGLAS